MTQTDSPSRDGSNAETKLGDLLDDFKCGMLTTVAPDASVVSRPMWIADRGDTGELWFATDRDSAKVHEANSHHHAAVVFQGDSKFISLSGTLGIVDDHAKVRQMWSEFWRVWFPDGPDDDSIVLLHFKPDTGEYWDNSGLTGWRYMVKAGVAYFTGQRPDQDADINAQVKL